MNGRLRCRAWSSATGAPHPPLRGTLSRAGEGWSAGHAAAPAARIMIATNPHRAPLRGTRSCARERAGVRAALRQRSTASATGT